MQHLIYIKFRILFALMGLILLFSCATQKPEDPLLQDTNQEKMLKDGPSRSFDEKINSIDQLIDYLGLVSPEAETFEAAFESYSEDRKQIIGQYDDISKVKSSLQERESEFLASLDEYMTPEQYDKYVNYINQKKDSQSGKDHF